MSVPQADPLEEAARLRKTGNRAGALAAIGQVLSSLEPGDVGRHLGLARELVELDEFERAESLLRLVLDRDPHHPWAGNALALLHRRRGRFARAAESFLALADRHRDIPILRLQACVDLQTLRRFADAIPHLEAFLEHEPRHFDARLRRAAALRETHQHDKAIAQYRELLDEEGANIPVLVGLARSLEATDRFHECMDVARRIRSIQPDHMGALFLLAHALERTGDGAGAVEAWRDGVDLDPDAVAPQMHYAEALFRAGLYEEAQERWRLCRKRFAADVEVLIGAGLFARRLGRRAEAAAALLEAWSIAPERPRLSFECARELAYLGRMEQARRHLAQEPSGDRDVVEFRSTLDQLLGGGHRPMNDVSPHDPGPISDAAEDASWERCLDDAQAYAARGDFDSCRLALGRAYDRVLKTGVDSQAQLQRLLWDLHRFGQAEWHAALLAHFRAASPHFINHGAVIQQLAESGRADRAEELIAAVLARVGRQAADRLRVKLACVHHGVGAAAVLGAQGIGADRIVTLADLKDWLRILIDAERIGEARGLLLRHEQAFAVTDLVEERAEILRLDLRLSDELAMLEAQRRRDPHDERCALQLTRALAVRGQCPEAGAVLAAWEGRAARKLDWLRASVDVAFHGARDWDELFAAHDRARREADPNERMALWPLLIEHLMLQGRHDRADEQVDAFLAALRCHPMHAIARGWNLVSSASRLLRLRRHAEATAILADLQERPLPAWHDALHRTCAANAAYQHQVEPFEHHMSVLRRVRDRVAPTPFAPGAAGECAPVRVAVLVHLFYPEWWPELSRYLQSLDGTDFKLFVSIGSLHAGSGVEAMIRERFPDADVAVTQNRGFDVGAHWQTLRRVDLSRFDVAVLLQSKKSQHVRVGDAWRHNLVSALVGTPAKWRDNLRTFASDARVGMIASAFHRNTRDVLLCEEMRRTLDVLGMPTDFDTLKDHYAFVGGTMLIIRAHLLAEIHERTVSRIEFEPYENLTLAKRRDGTFAHAIERVLGLYVAWRGHRTIWRT